MLRGLRDGAWAKSGGGSPTARDYVQDGLVAMWDGIENAGFGVHDPNATTWKDLVGNRDIAIPSTAEVSNDAVFLKSNLNAFTSTNLEDDETLEMSILSYSTGGDNRILTSSSTSTRAFGLQGGHASGSRAGYRCGNFISTLIGQSETDLASPVSGTFSLTLSRSVISENAGFLDGGKRLIRCDWATNPSASVYSFGMYFQCASSPTVFRSIRMYNRILSQSEIAANYAVDIARFGLP